MVTKTIQGYGRIPSFMVGGQMPMSPDQEMDPMGGGMPGGEMSAPPAPGAEGPMGEIAPMIEAYMGSPDPALAEQIIMTLAQSLGIAPGTPPMEDPMGGMGGGMGGPPPMGGGAPPMGGGSPAPFEKGGKFSHMLNSLKLG